MTVDKLARHSNITKISTFIISQSILNVTDYKPLHDDTFHPIRQILQYDA